MSTNPHARRDRPTSEYDRGRTEPRRDTVATDQENLATPGPTRAAIGLRVADRGTNRSMGSRGSRDTQRQLDALGAQLTQNHDDIAALQETVAQAGRRAGLSEGRADDTDRRLAQLEARCDEHRKMIIELQAQALISKTHAASLEAALLTSRMIGAAVGIVMAFYGVTESGGFEILKKASQDSNRKLRVLAEEVVWTGNVTTLPPPGSRQSKPRSQPGKTSPGRCSS